MVCGHRHGRTAQPQSRAWEMANTGGLPSGQRSADIKRKEMNMGIKRTALAALAAVVMAAGAYAADFPAYLKMEGTKVVGYVKNRLPADLVIPEGVTVIGYRAFFECRDIRSVTIPSSVKEIEYDAFLLCGGLTRLTIAEGVTKMWGTAFAKCPSLTEISIPRSVTSIGYNTFEYCTGLTSVTIPGTVGVVMNGLFTGCTGLESVVIEEGVTEIEPNAFWECLWLERVSIPVSVKKIGTCAFFGCGELRDVDYAGTKKQWKAIKSPSGRGRTPAPFVKGMGTVVHCTDGDITL